MRRSRPVAISSFVPPYVIEQAARRGVGVQKDVALRTLQLSSAIRGQRKVLGSIAKAVAMAPGQKRRHIYDARGLEDIPGFLVLDEGGAPSEDKAVNEAYEGSGAVFDFLGQVLQRNSIDDRGMDLTSSVHFGQGYDNAFWNGVQMTYGDGSGVLFKVGSFTGAIDVIAHEMGHGITQYEANLAYFDQPGALNESFSDVIGCMFKQWYLKQTVNDADWLIGPGMFVSSINAVAIRSMSNPGTAFDDPLVGKDPQPGHMRDYVNTIDDNGGVHINSGIPNRAFYLAAMKIGGYSWEKAGMVWYIALRDKLRSRSRFREAANATSGVAGSLFGNGSPEQVAVKEAWAEVGVPVR